MNIQTERLRLRNFSLEDTGQAAFYLQDPQVMQYVEPPFGEEQIQRFIRCCGLCQPPLVYALEERQSGLLTGHVIFHPFDSEGWEVGWILGRAYQHKGYAWEISQALIAWARDMKIPYLVAETVPENNASVALIQKLGFEKQRPQGALLQFRLELGEKWNGL